MTDIKTTLGQLVGAEAALKRLADERLPVKAAYQVAKLIRQILPELQHWHTERQGYIRELGVERDPTMVERDTIGPGKVFAVMQDNLPEFHRRLDQLASVEVVVAADPLDLSELFATELSASEINALGPLCDMPEGR